MAHTDDRDLLFTWRVGFLLFLGLLITGALGTALIQQFYNGSMVPIIVMIIFGFFAYVLMYFKLKYIWEEIMSAKSKRTYLLNILTNKRKLAMQTFQNHNIKITDDNKEVDKIDSGIYTAKLENKKKVSVKFNKDYQKYSMFFFPLKSNINTDTVDELHSMINSYFEKIHENSKLQVPAVGCKTSVVHNDVDVLIPFRLDTLDDALEILKIASVHAK
ncbi:MAG: hypothetical protein V1672_01285 [Candidatus Diapherotrites archaeon]